MAKLVSMPCAQKTSSASQSNSGLPGSGNVKSPAALQRGFFLRAIEPFALEDKLHKEPSLESGVPQVGHAEPWIECTGSVGSCADQSVVVIPVEQICARRTDVRGCSA